MRGKAAAAARRRAGRVAQMPRGRRPTSSAARPASEMADGYRDGTRVMISRHRRAAATLHADISPFEMTTREIAS